MVFSYGCCNISGSIVTLMKTVKPHVEAMVLWRDAIDILHLILCFHSRKTRPEMTKNDGVNIITTAYKISRN